VFENLNVCSELFFQGHKIVPVPTLYQKANHFQDVIEKITLPDGNQQIIDKATIPPGFSNFGTATTMVYYHGPIVRNTFNEAQSFTTKTIITYMVAEGGPVITAEQVAEHNTLNPDWVTTLFDTGFFDFDFFVTFLSLTFEIISEKGTFDLITPIDSIDYSIQVLPNKVLSFNYNGLPNNNIFDDTEALERKFKAIKTK
jgi:hypothetical protein